MRKVRIEFYGGRILIGTVDSRQLFDFRNRLSPSLYVKSSISKDEMIYEGQSILRIEEIN